MHGQPHITSSLCLRSLYFGHIQFDAYTIVNISVYISFCSVTHCLMCIHLEGKAEPRYSGGTVKTSCNQQLQNAAQKKEQLFRGFFLTFLFLRGRSVVKVLCYKSEGRWFDPSWCHWNLSSLRSHYGHGVDLASNRIEYQEYFLGVKAAVA